MSDFSTLQSPGRKNGTNKRIPGAELVWVKMDDERTHERDRERGEQRTLIGDLDADPAGQAHFLSATQIHHCFVLC